MVNNSNGGSDDLAGLSARVKDIESTIGDLAQVLNDVKLALGRIPLPPTCPPYCGRSMDNPVEDEDKLEPKERLADVRKWIGDFGMIFDTLKKSLNRIKPPTCPPYCAHKVDEY